MTVALAVLLSRIATELRGSAHHSAVLESMVQQALSAQDVSGMPSERPAIQGMDLLTQRLADLARFMESLASKAPDQTIHLEEALAILCLRYLRHGLSGQSCDAQCEAGYVDMF